MTEYPEHEKLKKVSSESQAIGEFLDFGLAEQGLVLGEYVADDWGNERLTASGRSIQTILAKHFKIDEQKIEAEKRQMLDSIREGAK